MSKSKKQNPKYNPKEIIQDINKILNLTNIFKEDITKIDIEDFSKKVDKIKNEINKKYSSSPKDLDSEK